MEASDESAADVTRTLAYAYGGPVGSAVMRSTPEDFRVVEDLGFHPTGAGEHLFVYVRKRGWTTDQVAGILAREAGLPRKAVSYAGMKDKWAVTEQWFSVHRPLHESLPIGAIADGVTVLEQCRHNRKLRRGALRGNRFELILRDVDAPQTRIAQRLTAAGLFGVPNYFGEQRFGADGNNITRAEAFLDSRLKPRSRHERGIYLSTARSFIFNEVLEARVRAHDWDVPLEGDLLMLDGTRSVFEASGDWALLRRRVALMDVHPTGPLAGRGGPRPTGSSGQLETKVLSHHESLIAGLEGQGVEAARRSLRLKVADLAWRMIDGDALALEFCLPAGGYATCVVREVVDVQRKG